ncbi:MAG: VCBS repeat-containing protein [Planctomycetota bacterium]
MLLGALAASALAAAGSAQSFDFEDETSARTRSNPNEQIPYPALTYFDTTDMATYVAEVDMDAADFDQNGRVDVCITSKAVGYHQQGLPGLLLMNYEGILTDMTEILAPQLSAQPWLNGRDIEAVDVNNDGWEDIVIAFTFDPDPILLYNLGNDSTGAFRGFTTAVDWFTAEDGTNSFNGTLWCCEIGSGDINNDGNVDLLFTNYKSDLTTHGKLLIGQGNGRFIEVTSLAIANDAAGVPIHETGQTTVGEMVDLNNDGADDMVLMEPLSGGDFIYNNGIGRFDVDDDQILVSSMPYSFVAGQLDPSSTLPGFYIVDDFQDVFQFVDSVNPDGTVNLGPGTTIQAAKIGGIGGNVKLADMDNDGDLDVGVADQDTLDFFDCDRQFCLLENDTSDPLAIDIFDPHEGTSLPWHVFGSWDFVLEDIDGDGCRDIVIVSCTGGLQVFIQKNCGV